jgi:O-antigen/teichoic acid export membrane protein
MKLFPDSIVRVVRNSFSTVLVRGTFGFARIIVLLFLAKTYGVREFGLFSLILIFIEIAKVVCDLGVDIVSIRRFAADPKNSPAILNSILGLKLLSATFGCVLTIGLYVFLYGDSYGLIILSIACVSIYTSLFLNGLVSYYQTNLSMEKIIRAYLIGYGCYLVFSVSAILFRTSLIVLVSIIPLTEGIILFLLVRQYLTNASLRICIDISFIRSLLSESIYVGLAGIAVVIYMRLDNVMISRMLDLKSVGQYAIAYRLTEPFSLLFSSFGISIYASLSSLSLATTVHQRYTYARKYLLGMVAVACAGILGYVFVVRPLLPIFSQEYAESGTVLLILSFVLLFKALNTQMTAILNSMEKFRIVSGITFINLVASFLLNVIFISHYGIVGAAMAVVGTECINSLFQGGSLAYYHSCGTQSDRL